MNPNSANIWDFWLKSVYMWNQEIFWEKLISKKERILHMGLVQKWHFSVWSSKTVF